MRNVSIHEHLSHFSKIKTLVKRNGLCLGAELNHLVMLAIRIIQQGLQDRTADPLAALRRQHGDASNMPIRRNTPASYRLAITA